jgi:hypothetical protein
MTLPKGSSVRSENAAMSTEPVLWDIETCHAVRKTKVLDHYAYGDPQPRFARYVADNEEGSAPFDEAITIYVQCEREKGHTGQHLARGVGGWS